MIVTPVQTVRVTAGSHTLVQLLDEYITELPPKSVLAIASKVVSLCENRVLPMEGTDKQALVRAECEQYAADADSPGGTPFVFTVTHNKLIPNAGIDESNVGGVYALWPADPQASANAVRHYLTERFGHDEIGVVITDSTCRPLIRGVSGIYLAFSGIKPLRNYVGEPDLFGRPFAVAQADIVGGLAATAVLVGGEGAECTPFVVMNDVTTADFVARGPTDEELASLHITQDEDLFAPFLNGVTWLPGGKHQA